MNYIFRKNYSIIINRIIFNQKIILLFFLLLYGICYINNFNNIKNNIIRIGIIAQSLKNGGCERQTSLILKYFNKINKFQLFLFTKKDKDENEYIIGKEIKRIILKDNLINQLKNENIDILLYQFYDYNEIKNLFKIKKMNVIIINRSCFLHWIYYNNYKMFQTYYKTIKNATYIISLIPFENDYLFKKWGINSILMNNFLSYEYNSITPSNLSSKMILMIGRGNDYIKRFDLGIKAMKYIVDKIPECTMKIVSSNNNIDYLKDIVKELNLSKYIEFVGYTSKPEKFFKKASLHLFPTLVESFGNVLTETLSYGIPNILVGLDYVSASNKGGTIIIYDDSPISLANIAIKVLLNNTYLKTLGKEARNSIKQFKNDLLLKRWAKLIISIYKGTDYYKKLINQDTKINSKDSKKIIENQLNLLRKRKKDFLNISINDIENFTFMENLK